MSPSKTPCAACKLQRRKCTPECVFAPYFPPENPQKFQNVHQVFGASNMSKLLSDLDVSQREEAVVSLAFEADARIKDPVYGCVGPISVMQHKLRYLNSEIEKAQKELALYEGALQVSGGLDPRHGGMVPPIHPAAAGNIYVASSVFSYNNMPVPQAMAAAAAAAASGGGNLVIRDPQQQQQMLGSQLGALDMEARQAQELFGIYNQQQQQAPSPQRKDFVSYGGGGTVFGSGFNHLAAEMSASLSLNTFDSHGHHQQQTPRHNLQEQMLLLQPQQQQNQNNQLLHNHLQEQLILSSQQQHQLHEQQTQSQQQQQQQQQQRHHHNHHQLQEQLFLGSQQPQERQQDHQHNQHSELQEQLLLPPQQAQSQQQEQSKDEDGRSVVSPS